MFSIKLCLQIRSSRNSVGPPKIDGVVDPMSSSWIFFSQKVCMIGTKYDNLYRISTYHFYKVTIHCSSEFQRRKFVFISGNQKAELPIAIMFLSNRYEMRKSYRGPSIHASCKMLLYLIKWFQWRRFLEIN